MFGSSSLFKLVVEVEELLCQFNGVVRESVFVPPHMHKNIPGLRSVTVTGYSCPYMIVAKEMNDDQCVKRHCDDGERFLH